MLDRNASGSGIFVMESVPVPYFAIEILYTDSCCNLIDHRCGYLLYPWKKSKQGYKDPRMYSFHRPLCLYAVYER